MFDVSTYLQRIGCAGETGVNIETLRKLQKSHLMTIPYSSVAYELRDAVDVVGLDEDAVFETSIAKGKGGACYHLNRLFHRLLAELGYDVTLIAGSTTEGRETFGTEIEHMFNRVTLDGGEWLVDVGYPGPTYVEPLPVTDSVQTQYGSTFRLIVYDFERQRVGRRDDRHFFNPRRPRPGDKATVGAQVTDRRHVVPIPAFAAFENGQVFLRQRRYLTIRNGREQVRTITDDDEHGTLLSRILHGELG